MRTVVARGRVVAINVSRGGVPKRAIDDAKVTVEGIVGDLHDDVENHGGPERALCLYTLEQISALQREGHPIAPGTAGENITLAEIPLGVLTPGTCLTLGNELEIEITRYTSPCKTIARSFSDGDFTRIAQKLHPDESRVYAKVIAGGTLRHGDVVEVFTGAARHEAHE